MEKKEIQNLTFEDSMKQLDNIANQLENGDLNLEESIQKFEEGMRLSKQCKELLEGAEKKITILMEENGTMKEKDFIVSEEE